MVVKISDHVRRALSRVVTDLRGSEFENLVRVFAPQVQFWEDAFFPALQAIRDPNFATGWLLDLLGKLVGAEERGALSDADYRLRIRTAIKRNRSWGIPEDLISTVLTFFPFLTGILAFRDAGDPEGGTGCAIFAPSSYFTADGYQPITPTQAEELLRYLPRPAGTRIQFAYAQDADFDVAVFDTGGGQGFDGPAGFAASVDQYTLNN